MRKTQLAHLMRMMASIVSFECADFRDTRLIKIAFWPHPERRLDEIVRRGHLARPSFSVAILRHGSVGLANLVTPTARSSGRVGAGMFSLTPRLPLCSCFVRDRPIARANHGRRSAPGQHTPAPALGRVLSLVRKLIDYGKQLADTVQLRATTPGFALLARPFGTADLAVIIARITNGLRRAAALEATLCQRAARGQDLTPTPIRAPAAPEPRPARQSHRRTPSPPTPPRTPASPACPRSKRSPPRCVAARSAPSSPISAMT